MDIPSEMNVLEAGTPIIASSDSVTSFLKTELIAQKTLFDAQPEIVRRFLEAQAGNLAQAILEGQVHFEFTLPDQVVRVDLEQCRSQLISVEPSQRKQLAGGVFDRLAGSGAKHILHRRLQALECSPEPGISISARLLQYSIAIYMLYTMLPSGNNVLYEKANGDEFPTQPSKDGKIKKSALIAKTDAIAEDDSESEKYEDLFTPYHPSARQFYLPQWVSFDDSGKLLLNSNNEAEAYLASMQRFMHILNTASSLAPYLVADDTYQQKRYGILGQLINQGRALALYQTCEIILEIHRRAAAQDLNRGFSLSLPYFDDQQLEIKSHTFVVIPAGRIMFVPVLVANAARNEEIKVSQDIDLSISTRKHLQNLLTTLRESFDIPGKIW
jgi:hypothetical protein